MAKDEKVQVGTSSDKPQPPPARRMIIIGGVTLAALLIAAKWKDLAGFFEGRFKRAEVVQEKKAPAPQPEKSQPLTALEAREWVGDIAALKRLAVEKRKEGERIHKIVMAGENVAKVLYVSGQEKTARTEAFLKEQGKWQ